MSLSESRILELAIEHLEQQKRQIDEEIDELRTMLKQYGIHRRKRIAEFENQGEAPPAKRGRKPRRQMTDEQKQAISEKMKQRWAERRAVRE
ncbi:MAG TPA: hypothetical protein VFC63_25345 [Blastocatellia bacterium]|nr:hypothetical protein [Blastocatellia bacterium]